MLLLPEEAESHHQEVIDEVACEGFGPTGWRQHKGKYMEKWSHSWQVRILMVCRTQN